MPKPLISIIVAHDETMAIGKNNGLLWRIPEDLKHFKEITMGHPIIMGRKTFESIGRSLPGRTNIIISRQADLNIDGAIVVDSLEKAIDAASRTDQREIFIIGGGMIYAEALPLADKLYITLVEGEHHAEVFFPPYEHEFSKIVKEEQHNSGQYKFTFYELTRGQT